MSHIITLLSDLGTGDSSLTMAKAQLLRYAPDATIIDISHHVRQYDLQQAAYLLLSAYSHFLPGTIHVLPVDVFSGEEPRIVLTGKDGHYFIAPDNGLLSLAFGTDPGTTLHCYYVHKPYLFSEWINSAGKVIEQLYNGTAKATYTHCDIKNTTKLLQPTTTNDGIECNILHVDRYENIVLDITREQFRELINDRSFRIILMKVADITQVSNNYNDVPKGEALCRFNQSGFLEIALNHGKAASLLGLGADIRYPTIKIFF